MSKLNDAQFLFSECLGKLIAEVGRRSERCTIGDVWAVDFRWMLKSLGWIIKHLLAVVPTSGMPETLNKIIKELHARLHSWNSNHYDKLAVDVNLFKPVPLYTLESTKKKWHYCTTTEDHAELGAFWKSLHPACEWGGDLKDEKGRPIHDGNHYAVNKEKV